MWISNHGPAMPHEWVGHGGKKILLCSVSNCLWIAGLVEGGVLRLHTDTIVKHRWSRMLEMIGNWTYIVCVCFTC